MKIRFTRSGGFAGLVQRCDVDLDDLPEPDRAELLGLVERADFFALPAERRSPHPDAFQYTIAVEDGARQREIRVDERGAPENVRPLIAHLTRLAR